MTLSMGGFNPYCNNANNGQVWVVPSGGVQPYSYSWNTGASTYLATGLSGGTYTVWVTDATSCSQNASYTIINPGSITVAATGYPGCGCNGYATATSFSGGVPPYVYSWAPVMNTSVTASFLCPGIYTLFVTDANGCIAQDTATVTGITSNLAITGTQINPGCATPTGSINTSTTGGVPPYSYQWTITNQTTANVTGLSPGSYTVTVTDANGCVASNYWVLPLTNPININPTVTNPACIDGAIATNPSGGTPPYYYQWSNNSTSQSISNLGAGGYWVTVSDVNGCSNSTSFLLTNTGPGPGCSYVSGRVYRDRDLDCIYNNADNGLGGRLMTATPGPFYETTDSYGNYTFVLPYGTYSISQNLPLNWFQECPVGNISVTTTSTNDNVTGQDLADTVLTNNNLQIWHYCPLMRPGEMQYPYGLAYRNIGNANASGTVWFKTDDTLTFMSAVPAPSSVSNDTLYWNFSNIPPNQIFNIYVTDSVPYDINLIGYNVNSFSGITPVLNDVDPSDNIYNCSRIIIASFDPNLKEVEPKGIGPQGYITTADSVLNYTIHFQNTGTDTAFNIIVRDTLSPNLDMSTVESGPSSHSYTFSIYGTGILKWTLNNILLPDSNVNEPLSHGYVSFRVKQKPNLQPGNTIDNTAGIYFDFNPPVITNTVRNTISAITEVRSLSKAGSDLIAFPNPFSSTISLGYEMNKPGKVEIEIVDLLGRTCYSTSEWHASSGKCVTVLNLEALNAGTYFAKFTTNEGQYFSKLVKQ